MSGYIGRFAPSPTGPLHFGSLVAAVASWLDARAAGGRWLVRIEDVDRPRVVPGAADRILSQLRSLGLTWDDEVLVQSQRIEHYRCALERLSSSGFTFACGCSRREIADTSPGGASVYPGTCRDGLRSRTMRSRRLAIGQEIIGFDDRVQGTISQDLAREVGDFVLWRTDGLYAYQLAVVVDDAAQGVTDVVRGADLLDSTARQILLQRRLGLPTPRYLHVPVAVDATGQKLSKQQGAAPIDESDPAAAIRLALEFLGQSPIESGSLAKVLEAAVTRWEPGRIPALRAGRADLRAGRGDLGAGGADNDGRNRDVHRH